MLLLLMLLLPGAARTNTIFGHGGRRMFLMGDETAARQAQRD